MTKEVTAYEDDYGGVHKTKEAANAANRDTLLRSIVSRAKHHLQKNVSEHYVVYPEDVVEFLLRHNAEDLRKLLAEAEADQ